MAIYIRVSTEDQLDGYGPETQKQSVLNLIKAKEGLVEPLVFAGEKHIYFDEGVSGTIALDERPQFVRLKEAIYYSSKENRPFDVVAVYRIDRFARKLTVLLEVIDFFEENEIEFLSVTENIDTSSPFGRAILSIIGVIAELELNSIKQRTQDGRIQAIQVGVYMGNAPIYGYKKTLEKKLETFEVEAKNVELIFDLFVNQKYSVGEIALYLQEHSIMSPEVSAIHHGKRKGIVKKQNSQFHWSHESVRRILKNEIYTGNYYYKKTKNRKTIPKKDWKLSPFLFPIIIDSLTYGKAQELFDQPKHIRKETRRREHPYLLSGLLKCDYCRDFRKESGSHQHWVGAPKKIKSSGKYTHYYSCGRKNRKKYEKPCTVLPLPAKEIEDYVMNYCLDLLNSPVSVFQHQQKLKSEKISLKYIQKRIKNLNGLLTALPKRKNHLLEQHEHGHLNSKALDEKFEELKKSEIRYKEELIQAQKQISENTLSENYIKTLELFDKKYRKTLSDIKKDPDEVYRILHLLVEEIIVYSRPLTKEDVIAGRKSKDQQIPARLHIKLKLPQEILNEVAREKNPSIPKASLDGDASSSYKNSAGARRGIRTPDPLGVNEML